MRSRPLPCTLLAALAVVGTGCGTTERSGEVGDSLSAKDLEVSVERVDTSVPVPGGDVTGLSLPAPGSKLVGALVRVCSEHGAAIGPYDFGVETDSGEAASLKYPARNYAKPFEPLRSDCGGGWIVFEIPAGSRPEQITFGFENTGSAAPGDQGEVDARFSWAVDRRG